MALAEKDDALRLTLVNVKLRPAMPGASSSTVCAPMMEASNGNSPLRNVAAGAFACRRSAQMVDVPGVGREIGSASGEIDIVMARTAGRTARLGHNAPSQRPVEVHPNERVSEGPLVQLLA